MLRAIRNAGWQERKKKDKEAERRRTHFAMDRIAADKFTQPAQTICHAAARGSPRARLSASHHGACWRDRTPQLNSSGALPEADCAEAGITRPLPHQYSEVHLAGRS